MTGPVSYPHQVVVVVVVVVFVVIVVFAVIIFSLRSLFLLLSWFSSPREVVRLTRESDLDLEPTRHRSIRGQWQLSNAL